MPLATAPVILQDYSLEVMLLPLVTSGFAAGTSDRNISSFRRVLTCTTQVAPPTSGGVATLALTTDEGSSSSPTVIKEGTGLSFIEPLAQGAPAGTVRTRIQVMAAEDKSIAHGSSATDLKVIGLDRTIAANSTAALIEGLLPLSGIQTLDLSNQETQVDTTSFQSGSGTEMAMIRVARAYSVSGIALAGDEALERVIKPVAGFQGEFFGREIYAVATFPDGERLAGAAKVTAFNFPANQNEVKKYSFTLTFMGKSFEWNPPYSIS